MGFRGRFVKERLQRMNADGNWRDLTTSHAMRQLAALLLILLACGCTDTVTKAGLDAKTTEHAGFSFPDQTFYVGSDRGYDYFIIRRGLGGSTRRYRVLQSEGAVTNRFNVTKDETHWRGYGITGMVVTNASQIAFVLDEAQVLAIARAAVATNDTWLDRAEFETPRQQPDGSWQVLVRRLPATPGGDRLITIDEKGNVTRYGRGL
jgi:hypothetical protein